MSQNAGLDCDFAKCDVSVESDVVDVVTKAASKTGRIDILMNNAGIVLIKALTETTKEEFEKVINVNLGGTFLFCKHVIPIMQKQGGGVIINMASVAGHVGQIYHTIYGATKGAIMSLTRALAWEVAA